MTGVEEIAAGALLLRLGAALAGAWAAGRVTQDISKNLAHQNSSSETPQAAPAEQNKDAEDKSQALSPGDPKEPCGECGKEERQERQNKRRKELEEEAGVEQRTKGKTRHGEKSGGMDQANKDFDSLEPSNVKEIRTNYGPGRVGYLEDGSTVVARPGSSEGPPTLEIRHPSSKRGVEIRY